MCTSYLINTDPKTWPAYDSGHRHKSGIGNKEVILQVTYGISRDDNNKFQNLDLYMRKSIYEKLVSGEYHIQTTENSKGFTIHDAANTRIPPISACFCY